MRTLKRRVEKRQNRKKNPFPLASRISFLLELLVKNDEEEIATEFNKDIEARRKITIGGIAKSEVRHCRELLKFNKNFYV